MDERGAIYKGMYGSDREAMTPERLEALRGADLHRFMVGYGGETRTQGGGETREGLGWTDRPSLDEGAVKLGSEYVRSAIDPIVRVGGMLSGKPPPYGAVDEINDVGTMNRAAVGDVMGALSVYGGGGVLRGRPTATSVGILGGQGAKEAPLRMKAIAEKALAAGKDPDEVWKWTGWKKGMEDKWRFEISDKDMVVNPEFWGQGGAKHSAWMDPKKNEWADVRMGQVVKHDAAYANYPEMKDVKVRLGEPEMMGKRNGFFDETTNTATIKANLTRDEAREVLLHEVGAHYVQGKEGFARGGSPSQFSDISVNEIASEWYKEWKKLDDMVSKRHNPLKIADQRLLVDELDAKLKMAQKNDVLSSEIQYRNLAGEIEAEDIVNRRTWDTDMRRAVPPAFSKDAIIRMRDK